MFEDEMINPITRMPVSFGQAGTEVQHDLVSNHLLVTGEKTVEFFQDTADFPWGQNVGKQAGMLSSNIGFTVYSLSLQAFIASSKVTLAGLNNIIDFLSKAIIRVSLAEDNYCEFSASAMLPSIVAAIQTASPNVNAVNMPISASQNIDVSMLPIPIGQLTTFKVEIISGVAITADGADNLLRMVLSGVRYKQSTSGSRV